MGEIEAVRHCPGIAALLSEPRLALLGPGKPVEAVRAKLAALTVENAFAPQGARDAEMARACLAGLWLYYDFLNESHEISQEIHTTTGSYWHGLMHRREPDYANAGYWFRRVGKHAIFDALVLEASRIAAAGATEPATAFLTQHTSWDPFAFIDLCERFHGSGSAGEMLCRQVQQREWELLFDFSFAKAVGPN
jgi:hypothetical protein